MTIKQKIIEEESEQVLYKGKWVDRKYFRAYVYNVSGQKLANSYKEYSELIESGLWYSCKEDIVPKQPIEIRRGRKLKHGADS